MRRPRQNIQEQQLQLACMVKPGGAAARTDHQGAARRAAQCPTERPAREEGLMEEVGELPSASARGNASERTRGVPVSMVAPLTRPWRTSASIGPPCTHTGSTGPLPRNRSSGCSSRSRAVGSGNSASLVSSIA
jgi:hypothetical protein